MKKQVLHHAVNTVSLGLILISRAEASRRLWQTADNAVPPAPAYFTMGADGFMSFNEVRGLSNPRKYFSEYLKIKV